MKKISVFIIFFLIVSNCFSQQPIIPKNELSYSRLSKHLEDAIINNRQDTILPRSLVGLSGEFDEHHSLRKEDLDRLIFIHKVDLLLDTLDGNYYFHTDTSKILIFRARKFNTPPSRFRFYYEVKKDNANKLTLHQKYRIDNPIVSRFATQIEDIDFKYACTIQLFTSMDNWGFNKTSYYDPDIFYYELKNGKGYFVDEGMITFDTLEDLLIHKFGSVDNYIEVYKIREKWLENEYIKRKEFEKNTSAEQKTLRTLRSSILPDN